MDTSVPVIHIIYFKMTFLLLAVQLKLKVDTHAFVNCDASGVKTCYVTFFCEWLVGG
jgi:hypothetical protein